MGHGVSINEVPTGVKPPVSVSPGMPVYIGTAPVNSVDVTNVNKAKLCNTLAEFEDQFGALSDDFASWTLHEAAKAHFVVYEVGPIVCVNVIDPANAAHKAVATDESHQLVSGAVQLQIYGGPDAPLLGIIESTVVVKVSGVTKALGTDYTLAFDADGFLVVTRVSTGTIPSDSSVITVSFSYLDPTGVTNNDVIGGYSAGVYTGIEVVEQVFPALRQVPGFLLAPKYSQAPTVAAKLATKSRSINGAFRAMALVDLSTDKGTIASSEAAPAWKTTNGFTSVDEVPCWPKVKNGSDVYHTSTVVACVANLTDADHQGIPYASPSNKSIQATSAVLDDGTEVLLTRPQANALNDQGIVTVLNGFNGWRLWGNRTGGYPASTDPKDTFIPIRRMFDWIETTVILTTDQNVDEPGNRRLIDSVNGTLGSFLNGLIAQQALLDGSKIEFRADENPATDLSDGKITWHVTATPPSPAQQLEFTVEYDPSLLAGLFQ